MTTPDPTFPGFEPEAAEINEAHEIWGTPKPTPYTPTPRIPKDRIPLVRAGFRAWIKANREKKVEVTS